MDDDKNLFYELTYYTLAHPDANYFIHQHVVDAYAAQKINEETKPIAITFALAGLYLFLEKGYTGRQIQKAHMAMANHKQTWPAFKIPKHRGDISVQEVLASTPGNDRDAMIKNWCASVWQAHTENHRTLKDLVNSILKLDSK
jgi:hypothetical protein